MLTKRAMRDGTKDVTRRLGWSSLKPGDRFLAVEQCQGLKKGGLTKDGRKPEVFGVMKCVRNEPEPLVRITDWPYRDSARREVEREGFGHLSEEQFVDMFCDHMKVEDTQVVNRIEFKPASR